MSLCEVKGQINLGDLHRVPLFLKEIRIAIAISGSIPKKVIKGLRR